MRCTHAFAPFGLAMLVGCLVPLPLAAAGPGPVHLEVFTREGEPIRALAAAERAGATVSVYRLDSLQRVEDTLSRGLPSVPQAAQREALARMHSMPNLRERLEPAVQGLVKALRYGLDRTPAIVIDGQTVIYGERDLVRALVAYRGRRPR